jgi:hypothetical protein
MSYDHSYRVNKTSHVGPRAFNNWLAVAAPGAELVYATGFLAVDNDSKNAGYQHLEELRLVALQASNAGFVTLTQRRLAFGEYEYIATKTMPSRRAA